MKKKKKILILAKKSVFRSLNEVSLKNVRYLRILKSSTEL